MSLPRILGERACGVGWAGVVIAAIGLRPDTGHAVEFPAASTAFTSGDPVVVAARGLLDGGDLADAERMLAAAPVDGDHADAAARMELLEIARRVRHDYTLDQAGLVESVRGVVPDATADEVAAWATEARLTAQADRWPSSAA